MSDEQTSCTRCGVRILKMTANERGGLCTPCSRGEREQINEGRRRFEEMKAYRQSPSWLFWKRLVAMSTAEMSEAESFYYAANLVRGEVLNGGFEQFFSNSSGSYYGIAERALRRLDATEAAGILRDAKTVLFGAADVPDWHGRNAVTRAIEHGSECYETLSALDKRFWELNEDLCERIESFGVECGFYPADA